MGWRKIIPIVILILLLIAVLIPTLAHEAAFPSTLSSQELGEWIGGIIHYWSNLFKMIADTIPSSTTGS